MLLEQVRSNTCNPAVQTSSHNPPEKQLVAIPDEVTHVFTRQHKALGLSTPWEGPFKIASRPSRSTVQIEVGTYKNGEKRYEIRHFNDLKLAHPDSLAAPAVRPSLGRPKTSTSNESPSSTDTAAKKPPSNRFPDPPTPTSSSGKQTFGSSQLDSHATSTAEQRSPALTANEEFQGTITGPPPQPAFTRPARATRNPNPYYVDGLSFAV